MEILDKLKLASPEIKVSDKGSVVLPDVDVGKSEQLATKNDLSTVESKIPTDYLPVIKEDENIYFSIGNELILESVYVSNLRTGIFDIVQEEGISATHLIYYKNVAGIDNSYCIANWDDLAYSGCQVLVTDKSVHDYVSNSLDNLGCRLDEFAQRDEVVINGYTDKDYEIPRVDIGCQYAKIRAGINARKVEFIVNYSGCDCVLMHFECGYPQVTFDTIPVFSEKISSISCFKSNQQLVSKLYVDDKISGVNIPDSYTKAESDAKYLPYTNCVIPCGFAGKVIEGPVAFSHGIYDKFLRIETGGVNLYTQEGVLAATISCGGAVNSKDLTTKEYVDGSIYTATKHLVTKSVQSPATEDGKWTITLDSEYTSAPFVQVFNGENKIVYPSVKFNAPSGLEIEFEGKSSISEGEFTAVISTPFTSTVELDETVVTINSDQGISGVKNFTGTLQYKGEEVATVDNLSTVETSVKSYVDDEISAKVASVYRFKGDSAYASLPTNAEIGDVYNLTTASGDYKIGDNVAWTGSKWDKLAATVDLSGYLTTSSASSTYLTKSSASSIYATKTDALSKSSTTAQTIAGPVTFNGDVSVSNLEIDNLSLETLEIGNEITVNDVAVSESINNLNSKTGSLEYILPAKTSSNSVIEWEVTINTDTTKTVKCPPNVIITDITGDRERYIYANIEWFGNKIYIIYDEDSSIPDNTFKVYITNIQLS